jgi:predicted phage terminase large subunit-like protein
MVSSATARASGLRGDRDKIARLSSVSGYVEAQIVVLPENQPWVYDLVEELANAGPTAEYWD